MRGIECSSIVESILLYLVVSSLCSRIKAEVLPDSTYIVLMTILKQLRLEQLFKGLCGLLPFVFAVKFESLLMKFECLLDLYNRLVVRIKLWFSIGWKLS